MEKVNAASNDKYFYSRPVASQIGAIASPQSRVIESRDWLDGHYKDLKRQLKMKLSNDQSTGADML